jgi:hypothetical protein
MLHFALIQHAESQRIPAGQSGPAKIETTLMKRSEFPFQRFLIRRLTRLKNLSWGLEEKPAWPVPERAK